MQISRKFGKQLGKHESHKRWIAVQFGLNTNNKVGQIQAILAQKKVFCCLLQVWNGLSSNASS